jgi:uncharacterized membrane protein
MVKLLHLLLFVYWLGADAGTFYASRFVADAKLNPAARATAAKIMLGIDLAPRVAMPLMLASGVHLAAALGALPLGATAVAGSWLLCAGWLAAVLAIHHRQPGRGAALVRADFVFRVVITAALAGCGVGALLAGTPALPGWLAIKLAAYAATVGCGLMIRIELRPFGAAFARRLGGGAGAEAEADDHAIARSLARCKPYVLAIWALLVLCAAAGLHLIG